MQRCASRSKYKTVLFLFHALSQGDMIEILSICITAMASMVFGNLVLGKGKKKDDKEVSGQREGRTKEKEGKEELQVLLRHDFWNLKMERDVLLELAHQMSGNYSKATSKNGVHEVVSGVMSFVDEREEYIQLLEERLLALERARQVEEKDYKRKFNSFIRCMTALGLKQDENGRYDIAELEKKVASLVKNKKTRLPPKYPNTPSARLIGAREKSGLT